MLSLSILPCSLRKFINAYFCIVGNGAYISGSNRPSNSASVLTSGSYPRPERLCTNGVAASSAAAELGCHYNRSFVEGMYWDSEEFGVYVSSHCKVV
jgi:hypothetical protein